MSEIWQSAKIVAGIITRRILTGPHSVQVSIVDACNYRCIMCWEHSSQIEGWGAAEIARNYHQQKNNKSTVMDFNMYKSFVTSLKETGCRQLGLSGIGEPLLHKRVVEAVAFGKQHDMSMWITTNGSLLNRDLIKELVPAGLDDLSVSMNAGASDEYGLVHTNQDPSRFDQIVENLVWLKEYKQKKGADLPRVSLSHVLSNLNSHRTLEMMKTGIRVGATSVNYRPIDTFSQTQSFSLDKEDLVKIRNAFPQARSLAAEHSITTNTDVFDRLIALRASNSLPSPCFAGWLYPLVLANGDVTFCCLSREVVGNLADSPFKQIWFSRERKNLNRTAVRIHKNQRPMPKSRCFGCGQMLANLKIYSRLWPLWGKPAI